jgi:hypothetical protein
MKHFLWSSHPALKETIYSTPQEQPSSLHAKKPTTRRNIVPTGEIVPEGSSQLMPYHLVKESPFSFV